MSLSPDAPLDVLRDHIVPAALSNYAGKIVTVCGMFLVCYEWVICLDREISVIWTGKMSLPKILYINVRLGNIALLTWLVICYLPDKVSSKLLSVEIYLIANDVDKGQIATEIEGFGGTITFLPVRILMLRRVAALYNNSRNIVRLLTAALILQVIGQYAVLFYTFYHVGWIYGVINEPIKGVAYQGCFHATVAPNFWLYWMFPYTTFSFAASSLRKAFEATEKGFNCHSFARVLVRDSLLYYIAVGAAETTTLIIWSKANGVDDLMTAGTAFGVIFEPILCCRLVLSTHDAISGFHSLTRTTAHDTQQPTTTTIEMDSRRPRRPGLDSLGYPKFSTFPSEEEAATNQDHVV